MTLSTTVLVAQGAAPKRAMLFLHGLLGTRANFRGIARKFVDARPDWAAVLVDLREHGDSLGLAGEDSIDACAADLEAVVGPAEIQGALGHSFGGKVAMRWAERARRPIEELLVLDASPSARPGGAAEARSVVALLRRAVAAAPEGYADRDAFTRFVVEQGQPRAIADWLAMNLGALPNGRRGLRLDLDRIETLLESHLATDTWGVVESGDFVKNIRFLLGGRSPTVDEEDRQRLARAQLAGRPVSVDIAPEAGHWVHVDSPGLVLAVLQKVN